MGRSFCKFLTAGLCLLLPLQSLAQTPYADCRHPYEMEAAAPAPDGLFPDGDLFRPLLADFKQPQFVAGRWRVKPREGPDFVGGNVAFGENFGVYRERFDGAGPCDGWQLSLNGGVFAQFNLSAPSSDLINADYIIGVPLTFRRGDASGRLRLYHQSSHLGDEFILGNPGINRLNLSFEESELLLSYDWRWLRVYGGLGFLLHRSPDLDRLRWQYGGELRYQLPGKVPFTATPVFFLLGAEIKQLEHHNYDLNYAVRSGFEIFRTPSGRQLRILAGYYKGFNPFGQFFDQRIQAFGVDLIFGF